jgi:hypothetical protein
VFVTSDPKCENCGHKWSLHHEMDRKGVARVVSCQARTARNWDDKARAYRDYEKCVCPCYRGLRPSRIYAAPDTCPHEYQPKSTTCVHCGQTAPKKKAKR